MISYRIARNDKVKLDPGWALVETFDCAKIVAEHFAVRSRFVGHPCGEDLYILTFELDHMPTGRRCYAGSPLIGASEPECEALALSLATLGDWSTEDVPDVDPGWFGLATAAAVDGCYVDRHGKTVGSLEEDAAGVDG
jgi:hypothetical protein